MAMTISAAAALAVAFLARPVDTGAVCAEGSFYHRCDCKLLKKQERISLAEAARRDLEPDTACSPPHIPPELLPVSRTMLRHCVESTIPKWGRVRVADLTGEPSLGESGGEGNESAMILVDGDGTMSPRTTGSTAIRRGEIVSTARKGAHSLEASTALKHNVTRGKGTFEHQSSETLNVELAFSDLGNAATFDCSTVRRAWDQLFDAVDDATVEKLLADYPTGVLVEEVKVGMTTAQVEGLMGSPERKADLGSKVVYFYPRMKLTFVGGKLADVE